MVAIPRFILPYMMLSRLSSVCLLQFCVLFCGLFFTNSTDNSCAFPVKHPVKIPIRNITYSNQLIRRGVALSVGSLV